MNKKYGDRFIRSFFYFSNLPYSDTIIEMSKFAENRKAYFNYEVLEKITAGIELLGFEVKAVKDGKIPRKSKNAALLTNAFAFGLSLGCLIFVPGITWSIFSLILMIITALSATSLYFVTEGVSDY